VTRLSRERLVTIVGTGGIGKTTVARYPERLPVVARMLTPGLRREAPSQVATDQ